MYKKFNVTDVINLIIHLKSNRNKKRFIISCYQSPLKQTPFHKSSARDRKLRLFDFHRPGFFNFQLEVALHHHERQIVRMFICVQAK